jgi:hypothetical protein
MCFFIGEAYTEIHKVVKFRKFALKIPTNNFSDRIKDFHWLDLTIACVQNNDIASFFRKPPSNWRQPSEALRGFPNTLLQYIVHFQQFMSHN